MGARLTILWKEFMWICNEGNEPLFITELDEEGINDIAPVDSGLDMEMRQTCILLGNSKEKTPLMASSMGFRLEN